MAAKNKKYIYFCYLLDEKDGIYPVQRDDMPEIRDFFTNNY